MLEWINKGIEKIKSEMKTLLDMPFTTMEPDDVLEPMRAVKGKNLDD